MFCSPDPCSCRAKPKPASKAKSPSAPPVVAPPTPLPVEEASPRDLELESALRCIRHLVTVEDRHRIDEILNPPRPRKVDMALTEWRARNEKKARY